jgi:hypothetical protein
LVAAAKRLAQFDSKVTQLLIRHPRSSLHVNASRRCGHAMSGFPLVLRSPEYSSEKEAFTVLQGTTETNAARYFGAGANGTTNRT